MGEVLMASIVGATQSTPPITVVTGAGTHASLNLGTPDLHQSCHPERSEGSLTASEQGSLATLGMTNLMNAQ